MGYRAPGCGFYRVEVEFRAVAFYSCLGLGFVEFKGNSLLSSTRVAFLEA